MLVFSSTVSADPDYYQAFTRADAAAKSGDLDLATRIVQSALRKYPRDYALTLKLASVEFQHEQYEVAERDYRAASALSDGSTAARLGIGWALVQQDRCPEGVKVLSDVLAEEPDAQSASSGLHVCAEQERWHGSVWAGLTGSLYQQHPWMHEGGGGWLGFNVLPPGGLELGATYRLLKVVARDPRVGGFTQHEAYAQAGYAGKTLDLLALGGWIWSGDAVVGGSRHVGGLARFKYPGALPGDVSLEVSSSYYRDLWVVRIAPAWTTTLGPLSLTAAVAVQQFEHETLGSGALTAALAWKDLSVWINGRAGTEYRAAYLAQSGVFNAEDRSDWGVSAGARWRANETYAFFAGYALLRLHTRDGLLSFLHNCNVGTVFTL